MAFADCKAGAAAAGWVAGQVAICAAHVAIGTSLHSTFRLASLASDANKRGTNSITSRAPRGLGLAACLSIPQDHKEGVHQDSTHSATRAATRVR